MIRSLVLVAVGFAACEPPGPSFEVHTREGDLASVRGHAEAAFGIRGQWEGATSCAITLPPPDRGWVVPLVHGFRITSPGNTELSVDDVVQVAMNDRSRLAPAEAEVIIFFLEHESALESECGLLSFGWDGDYGFVDPFARVLPAIDIDEATEVLSATERVLDTTFELANYVNTPEPPSGD